MRFSGDNCGGEGRRRGKIWACFSEMFLLVPTVYTFEVSFYPFLLLLLIVLYSFLLVGICLGTSVCVQKMANDTLFEIWRLCHIP